MHFNINFALTHLNSFRFYLTLLISTVLFLWNQKRRRWWYLTMTGIILIATLLMSVANYHLTPSGVHNILVFGGSMLVMTLLALLCCEISWEEAAFCAVAGYGVQFIISLCSEMCFRFFHLSSPEMFFCQVAIASVILPPMYALFGKQLRQGQNLDVDRRHMLLLVAGAVLTEIILCYQFRLRWAIIQNMPFMLVDALLLILCSIFILISQFALLVQRNLEDELKIINQMRRKDRDQYQISSETIDLINRKCHDMRHQIRTIGQTANVNPAAVKEMERSIGIYDAIYRTGCQALDIVLTEKSLYCQQNSISISCIADGPSLRFVSETDIYSLFGNLLDNAIHAVQDLPPAERIISLTIRRHGDLLSINAHNLYTGKIVMQNGLPLTTSGDPANHGFGTKSIVAIVNKYGGTTSFHVRDGEFNLNILFPLNKVKELGANL